MEFDINKYLAEFIEQWMSAEETIKQAERIRNEVVFPAIQELRYAGRRMVQVLDIINKSQVDGLPLTEEQAKECHRHAVEAVENCYKAKHDAIDAAIMFIHGEIDALVKQAGASTVLQAFSEFQSLRNEIKEIDKIIIESRANRNGLNEKYEIIKKEHLGKITDLFERILTKNEVMQAIAIQQQAFNLQQEKSNFRSGLTTGFITGLITGILSSLLVSLVLMKYEDSIKRYISPSSKQQIYNPPKDKQQGQ